MPGQLAKVASLKAHPTQQLQLESPPQTGRLQLPAAQSSHAVSSSTLIEAVGNETFVNTAFTEILFVLNFPNHGLDAAILQSTNSKPTFVP